MLTPKQLFAHKYESARHLEVPVLCCSKTVHGHEFHSAFPLLFIHGLPAGSENKERTMSNHQYFRSIHSPTHTFSNSLQIC